MADLVRGGVDREQVRRDAEWDGDEATGAWARRVRGHCLALLAELEQAEREVTLALNDLETLRTVVADFEARLAKVPALVETLKEIDRRERRSDYSSLASAPCEFANVARAALAEWERG